MDDATAIRLATDNLSDFKDYARIYYDEDQSLINNFLAPSFKAIGNLVEYNESNSIGFIELARNRALYAYNDKLHEFSTNYQSDIFDLSVESLGDADESDK